MYPAFRFRVRVPVKKLLTYPFVPKELPFNEYSKPSSAVTSKIYDPDAGAYIYVGNKQENNVFPVNVHLHSCLMRSNPR